MTHSFPFEQFQCDTRRGEPRHAEPRHGCLAVTGKKADETPGTKEMRQGLWGARAVTCIVCRRHLPLTFSRASSAPPSPPPPQLLGSISLSPFRCPLPRHGTRLLSACHVLARGFDAPSTGGTIAVGGVRVHRAAPRRSTPNHPRAGICY